MWLSRINTGIYRLNTILFVTFWSNVLLSQSTNIGTPIIINYSTEDYTAGTQNWDSDQANQSRIFWANNDGLLSFDGKNWKSNKIPNNTIVRSVLSTKDKIYVGGQDEIGFFAPDYNGELRFTTIKPTIDALYASMEDVWDIVKLNKSVFFRASNRVYSFDGDTTQVMYQGETINFLSKHNQFLLFNEYEKGIYRTHLDGTPTIIPGSEIFKDIPIVNILSLSGPNFLVLTEQNGIFNYDGTSFSQWESNADVYLKNNRIISGKILKNGYVAIGTFLGGLVIFNESGIAIHKLDKSNGLQNNSITSVVEDGDQNIWLGTYNGIDKIELNAGITEFFPDGEKEGALYDVELIFGKYFFGTSNGLYHIDTSAYYNPFIPNKFQLLKNTEGQVWGLDIIKDELILSHNDGGFRINENLNKSPISDVYGSWKCIELDESHMLQGTYDGLFLYEWRNNSWILQKKLDVFQESARFIHLDQFNTVWVTHPYRGVFKLKHSSDFKDWTIVKIDSTHGIINTNESFVLQADEAVLISNKQGVFSYDQDAEVFRKDSSISNLFPSNTFVKRLIQDKKSFWFIGDNTSGRIIRKGNGLISNYETTVFPALQNIFVGGFENLYSINSNEIFACTNKGVQYFTANTDTTNRARPPEIVSIKLSTADSIIYGGFGPPPAAVELETRYNNLIFEFADLYSTSISQYKYQLDGLDLHWSDWTTTTTKEYTNLDPGRYTFRVTAKGAEEEFNAFQFEVKPPWYQNAWAMIFYALIILGGIASLLLIPRQKLLKIIESQSKKQRETEAEIERIKSEKLKSEIIFKNKELASSTMHLLQKNQTLDTIRNEIEKIQKNIKDPTAKKEVKKIFSLLRSDGRLDNDWKKFSIHFDQVHHDFIKRIKIQFPQLSPKDQKLCAYLRMNLQTKEIAPLLNISVRGVEISRYRLRKKLNLDTSENLNEFLINY